MTFYPRTGCAVHRRLQPLLGRQGPRFDIDYRKLLEEFRKRGVLIRAYYYTALVEDQDYSPIRPLVDWLDYNGYSLVTKAAREYTDAQGRKRWRGDMDVEIAVDMMQMADSADHLVLFSGDGDFRVLVEAVQRKGARVTVVSTVKSQPPMASDDLRRQADNFVDLADLSDIIGRPSRLPRFIQESRAAERHAKTSRRPMPTPTPEAAEPPRDCPLCPRLVAYRAANAQAHPDWFNGPGPVLGRPRRAPAGGGPGARPRRGQPHGAAVHTAMARAGSSTRP